MVLLTVTAGQYAARRREGLMARNDALLKYVLTEAVSAANEAAGATEGAKALAQGLDEKISAALQNKAPMPAPDEISGWMTAIRANEQKARKAAEHFHDAHTALVALLST